MTVKTEVGEGEGTLIVRTVAETRDAAEHPRAHRKPPNKCYLAQKGNSAKTKKHWLGIG